MWLKNNKNIEYVEDTIADQRPAESILRRGGNPPSRENHSHELMKGTETIFVVGDHMEFLEIIRINFEDYGYNVLTAVDPYEAILICEAFADEIHLLITDVLMPKMSGKELYEWVRRKRPQMKTIFVSGFAAGMLRPHGVLTDGIEFMQKPFTPEALVRRVREVLAK